MPALHTTAEPTGPTGPADEADETPTILQAALDYAATTGRSVFFLSGSKAPLLGSHGYKDATADQTAIRKLFKKYPGAVGIGAPVPDGEFVLDVDPRRGGDAELERLTREHEPLPATQTTLTGGGGQHFRFRLPPRFKVKSRADLLGKGLDVKATGGFVVIPPSLHRSGRVYRWAKFCDPQNQKVADAPPWLIDLLLRGPQKVEAGRDGVKPAEVLRGVPEGKRDETLFRYACSLRARSIPRAEAEALVLAAARACRPPFPDGEARTKVESAWKFPEGANAPVDNREPSEWPWPDEREVSRREVPGWELMPETPPEPAGSLEAVDAESWRTPPEVIREIPDTAERLKTGISSLDENTRGGIPPGSVVVVGGQPGVGKTALIVQFSTRWAVRGEAAVVGLFADEGRDAASIRIGQSLGLPRQKLEAKDPKTLDAFAASLGEAWLLFPDPDEVGLTFESVAEAAKIRAPKDRPLVFVVDSVQTVKSAASGPEDGEREQIKALMAAFRRTAKRERAVVLVSSQINRMGFRHRKRSENTLEIASFTGSSAIEYGNDLAVVLDGDPESVVTAYLAKNRLGSRKARFSLAFDFERATFSEIDRKAAEETTKAESETRRRERVAALAEKIAGCLAKYGPLPSHDLRDKVGGNRDDVRDAAELLEGEGRAKWSRGPRGARVWSLAESAE